MATILHFDTLEYSKSARAKGFTEEQAEFQAEVLAKLSHGIEEQLATKESLKETEKTLVAKLDELDKKLSNKTNELEIKLNNKIDQLEIKLNNKIEDMGIKLTYQLTIRLGGLMITGMTVLSVLLTVLHK